MELLLIDLTEPKLDAAMYNALNSKFTHLTIRRKGKEDLTATSRKGRSHFYLKEDKGDLRHLILNEPFYVSVTVEFGSNRNWRPSRPEAFEIGGPWRILKT